MNIMVHTPKGPKLHGEIRGDKFFRQVDYHKDRMRIFDAWSIHPDALRKIEDLKIPYLHYRDSNGVDYLIKVEHARSRGWEGEFAGGRTFYIPLKYWNNRDTAQDKLNL